jgi:hypothetical protein
VRRRDKPRFSTVPGAQPAPILHHAFMANARRGTTAGRGDDELEKAFDKLEQETPDFLTRAICWLRKPQARMVRLPLGILCIIAGFLWFLPVVGLEFLPIGLLLIAQDVPFLRRPVGRMTLYVLDRWVRLRKWWARRRAERARRKEQEQLHGR